MGIDCILWSSGSVSSPSTCSSEAHGGCLSYHSLARHPLSSGLSACPGTIQGEDHAAGVPVLVVQELVQEAASVAGVRANHKPCETQHVVIMDHSKQGCSCVPFSVLL